MNVRIVVGSGYGDEGKGLMTDYFAGQVEKNGRALNIRTNGGTQAGHTACRIDEKEKRYNRWVFRNLGSGTFAGADTFLASRFILNCFELYREIQGFTRHFGYSPLVFISENCRIQFRADEALNRAIEEARTFKHGTCGLGIFETVNRNHKGFGLRVKDVKYYCDHGDIDELIDKISELSLNYIGVRLKDLKDTENLRPDVENILTSIQDYSFKTVEDIKELLSYTRTVGISDLDSLMTCGEYTDLIFECSQGLELNWGDPRNTPHTTASHTGLTNIIKEFKTCEHRDMVNDIEVCYVTRSYKTKHGSGDFPEVDYDIEDEYNLYDTTNAPNRFQGTLRYGRLDHIRMAELINSDFNKFIQEDLFGEQCKVTKSLAVTHLDQTCESVLLTDDTIFFKDFTAESVIDGQKTYYAFGEKAADIL